MKISQLNQRISREIKLLTYFIVLLIISISIYNYKIQRMSFDSNYVPPAPMKKILDGQENKIENPMTQLFSSLCKPAYAARLTEIIREK